MIDFHDMRLEIPHPTSKILSALTHEPHGFVLWQLCMAQNASY
jgi:hypothetical protein